MMLEPSTPRRTSKNLSLDTAPEDALPAAPASDRHQTIPKIPPVISRGYFRSEEPGCSSLRALCVLRVSAVGSPSRPSFLTYWLYRAAGFSLIAFWLLALQPRIFQPIGASSLGAQQSAQPKSEDPDAEFDRVFTNARRLYVKHQHPDAIKEFEKAAELRKGDCCECFKLMAQSYYQMSKYKEAAAAARRALQLKPDDEAQAQNVLGIMLYLEKDKTTLQEAIDAFKRAIELSKGELIESYYNLGYALLRQGREQDAVESFKAYLAADEKAPDAAEVRRILADPHAALEKEMGTKPEKSGKSAKSENSGKSEKLSRNKDAGKDSAEARPGSSAIPPIHTDSVSFSKLKGKIVLLDFWATWCGPCRQEMPTVKAIWEDFGGDNFIIVGISLDRDRRALEAYLNRERITWPQYLDKERGSEMARMYRVNSIPQCFLLDENGRIQATGLRGQALYNKVGQLVDRLRAEGGQSQNKK